MKTSAETLENNFAKVSVTLDADQVSQAFKKEYKEIAGKYNFPGFRRGKAPRAVINSMWGAEAIAAQVTENLVNENHAVAVDECNLFPIGAPKFDDKQPILAQDGKELSFSFEIELKPHFELSSYDPVTIEVPAEKVSDDAVQHEIDSIVAMYSTYEEASSATKAKEGMSLDLEVKATDDKKKPVAALSSDTRSYVLGSNTLTEAFDKTLVGLKKGEKASVEIAINEDSKAPFDQFIGKTKKIVLDVKVKAIKKKQEPQLTDEFVSKNFGHKNEAELREFILKMLQEQHEQMLPQIRDNRMLDALAARLEGELPESMIASYKEQIYKNLFTQLQQQGATLDQYMQAQGITSAQLHDDVAEQAQERLRQDLALDAWAAHNKFTVSDEDVSAEFDKSAVENPRAFEAAWRREGKLHMVREGVLRQKAVASVEESLLTVEEPKKKSAAKKTKASEKTETKDTKAADSSKSSAKKSSSKAEKADQTQESDKAEKAPAKKAATKKASAKKDDTKNSDTKAAPKKTAAKSSATRSK